MLLLPDRYENLDLSKDEKLMVNILKRRLDDDYIYLFKINPIGQRNAELSAFISRRGLFFIKYIDFDKTENFLLALDQVFYPMFEDNKSILINRFFGHKFLCKNSSTLKFPFNLMYCFPKIKWEKNNQNISKPEYREFINKHCLFNGAFAQLLNNTNKMIDGFFEAALADYQLPVGGLSDKEIDIIMQRIAPQYTRLRMGGLIDSEAIRKSNTTDHDYYLSDNDKMVNAFRLDNEQINLINNLKKGHQLILACAGSGKSVLLISKCFKAASMHPDRQFLITCYNRNLRNFYDWQIDAAGFREKNVICLNIDALCKRFLDKYRIKYDPGNIEEYFIKANRALNDGIIKERYFGIFIDEVQVFKPEWYRFCYNLLENRGTDDNFFVICGDKSQNINQNIKRGKAPWQGDPNLPKYKGRSIRIETNYRNSVQINDFINSFVDYSRRYFKRFNIEIDEDMFLRGKAYRQGSLPLIINLENYSNDDEAKAVTDSIKYMNKKCDIPYTEIAVLMFNRKYRKRFENWNSRYYEIHNTLITYLKREKIEYSNLSNFEDEYREHYAQRKGVSLITFEGALGLDFRGIIICGLKPMGFKLKSCDEKMLSLEDEELLERKDDFHKNINLLYTACTRAKDELHIIMPDSINNSIYLRILSMAYLDFKIRHRDG